jgi:hypothetical protein
MSVRWWWAEVETLGTEYIGPHTDARTGAPEVVWNDSVTDVGALVFGDGNDALVIEGSPETLHALLDRLRSQLPPIQEDPS